MNNDTEHRINFATELTPEQEAEVANRWITTMARIGVKPRADVSYGVMTLTPASGVHFDLLDIINGIADAADKAGAAGKP